jgi:hypothetical protein
MKDTGLQTNTDGGAHAPIKDIRVTLFLRFLLLGVLASVLGAASAPGAPDLEGTRHTDGRGTPKLVLPLLQAVPAARGRQAVAAFLAARRGDFKLAESVSSLELVLARESLLGTHYRYRQMLNGLPIEAAELVVSVSREDGQVYQAYNNTYPVEAAPALPKALIGASVALDAAWNHLRVHGRLLGQPRADLVYVPGKGGFRLVYKTLVAVEAPFGEWEHQIDAVSGRVVAVRDSVVCGSKQGRQLPDFAAYAGAVWPRTQAMQAFEAAAPAQPQAKETVKGAVDGSALVFDGDPRTYLANAALLDSSPPSAFSAAYVTRTLQGITLSGGVYSLTGPWVQIVDFEAPIDAPSTTADGQWTALRGNNAFNDAMTYFHIDQNQRYLQAVGYTGAMSIQALPIPADSDGVGGDGSSYYSPAYNRLAFGHGGVDDNEDADVILHEYGHAITHSIVPTFTGGDSGAIGEGFGDYWGASYSSTTTNGRTFHPEWAFSWDAHGADTWAGRFLDLTNLTYDSSHAYAAHETLNGIANYGDQLWSAPLFQSFLALQAMGYPRTNMDQIILEGQFGLGASATMRDLATATVNAAARLFPSGPHAGVFRDKFVRQLILLPPAVPAPQLVYPAGGETVMTGTVAQVQWSRQGAPAEAAARLEYSAGSMIVFSDTMEDGTGGWTVSHPSGSYDWTLMTSASHSASHSWFATDQGAVSDQYLASPPISVGSGAVLSFWHDYNLETGYDGGVVEVSTNGTNWDDLGVHSTQNGYNFTISGGYDNPIAGRPAFSGNSGGFIQTLISLSAYAGKSVRIRFREANDSSEAATGWWVDDVLVSADWVSVGTTATNAASYDWTVPNTPGTNCLLRIQQFAAGYSDSAWVQSAPFTISTSPPPTRVIGLSGSLAFGNVVTNTTATATLTLTNSGNATMTVSSISYPAGFSGAWSGTIAAAGSQSVTVTFAPTALTSYGGTVAVNSDATSGTSTISASGTGVVAPTRVIGLSGNLAFGNVVTNTTATATLTLTNSGNATLTVSSISYPSGFSGAWNGSIAAGASQAVTVSFTPTAMTAYSGTVTVNSDATDGTSTISVSGTGAGRIIGVSGKLAFGSMVTNTTATATLTITNSGNATLTVSSISYPSGFSGAWSGTIAAASSHAVTVTFAPTAMTAYSGTVTVNSDATGGTNTISVSGAGIGRVIGVSGNLAFGNVVTNTTATATLTITNSGNSSLTVSGITCPNGFSGAWSGTIPAAGSQDLTVSFTPTALTIYSATVTVNSDATGGTSTISASGTGIGRIIGVSGNLAFGNVVTNTTATATLTITNSGNVTMTVSSISYPSGFSGAWSGTIAAAGSQSVTVTFTPTALAVYSGTVMVNSDATGGTSTIGAFGTGVVAPTRIIGLSGNLAFGSVVTNTTATATLTITNSGNSTMTVSSISYPSGFSGAWSGTVAAAGSQSVTVIFAPTAVTSYSGTVTVNCDATSGTSTMGASGTGMLAPTRIIGLGGSLAFGNVFTNTTATATLVITNSGNLTMTVSSISYPAGFSGAWSGTVAPAGSHSVTVTFAPLAVISYSGTVTVNSDATSGTSTVGISGAGVRAPLLVSSRLVAPDKFAFSYDSLAGKTYVVEVKTNVVAATWSPVQTNAGDGSLQSCTNSTAATPRRYFRVRMQ